MVIQNGNGNVMQNGNGPKANQGASPEVIKGIVLQNGNGTKANQAASPEVIDPKGQLLNFCQKKVGRPMTKDDFAFTTDELTPNFKSTINLICLGSDLQFVGELCRTKKEAEKMAAKEALAHFEEEVIQVMGKPPAVRAAETKGPRSADTIKPKKSTVRVKDIIMVCRKILGRRVQKSEVDYNLQDVPGGYQATLQMTCLTGAHGARVVTGHVRSGIRDAERSVAALALEELKKDPKLANFFN